MNTIISEETEQGEVVFDVFSKLTEDRIIFISGYVDDRTATDIAATLLYLDHQDEERKVSLYLNVEGGDIRSVMMLYDVMKMVNCPIQTVCVGAAFDEAILILAAGTKGMRLATKSARLCLNNVSIEGAQHADMPKAIILMNEIKKENEQLMQAISKCTGKPISAIRKDAEKTTFFNATAAKKYGVIDAIIEGK